MPVQTQVLIILTALGGVLASATVVAGVLHVSQPESSAILNLNQRVRAWWVIVAVLGIAAFAGPIAITAVFAALSFLALREFLTVSAAGVADRHAMLFSFLIALPAQYVFAALGWAQLFILTIPVGGMIVIPLLRALVGGTTNFLARSTELYFSLMICVYGISHVPALLMIPIPGDRQLMLVAFLLLVSQANDVLQYLWGKLAGRNLLAPSVSPAKTVEGLAGGIVCATALGASLWKLTPLSSPQAALAAFVISLAATAGGLVLSAIKRDCGIKDWSRFVPGHGGVLDRLDSLCFSAPVFYHLVLIQQGRL